MYNKIEEAIKFCFIAHQNQKRNNADIGFAIHPISVGMTLKCLGYSDEMVIVGILHDVIEDTAHTYEEIKNIFGEKIAQKVLVLSEDKNIKNYIDRKTRFLEVLKNSSEDILIIECADKLHNLLFDYDINPNLLTDYPADRKWFYKEIFEIIKSKCDNELVSRFGEMIQKLN